MIKLPEGTDYDVPHFQPYDICRVAEGHLVIVNEVNKNLCQPEGRGRWSYAVREIVPGTVNKCAWYNPDELTYVNNIFEIIAKSSRHPFSSSDYHFKLKRRKPAGELT